eukprot:g789.t1
MLLRSAKREKAIKHLKSALSLTTTFSAVCHFNLGNVYQSFRNDASDERAKSHYQKAILDRPRMPEAWHNLGTLLLRLGKNKDALRCFFAAIEFREEYSDAFYNVATTLRRLGEQTRAITFTWDSLRRYLRRRDNRYTRVDIPPRPIDCKETSPSSADVVIFPAEAEKESESNLTVVCVKWGKKYGTDYVRNLRRGVRRHLRHPHTFICFTDEPTSLRGIDGVIARPLAKGWTGWWNKATLFSPEARLTGRILYIDLDTILVGPLDPVLDFRGRFATLSTDNFLNEGRVGGLNSSVMLWRADPSASSDLDMREIYERLVRYKADSVGKFVHRFDHWLEMNLAHVPRLQGLYPGMFVEYANDCKDGNAPPASSSVVNFPLQPKPHNVLSCEWVREAWGDADIDVCAGRASKKTDGDAGGLVVRVRGEAATRNEETGKGNESASLGSG